MYLTERLEGRKSDHRFDLFFEQHRKYDHVRRLGLG